MDIMPTASKTKLLILSPLVIRLTAPANLPINEDTMSSINTVKAFIKAPFTSENIKPIRHTSFYSCDYSVHLN